MNGTVKFFNQNKGYGFVTAEDGQDYFVHITGLNEGVSLEENDEVSFEVEQGDRGPKAVNVSKAQISRLTEEQQVRLLTISFLFYDFL